MRSSWVVCCGIDLDEWKQSEVTTHTWTLTLSFHALLPEEKKAHHASFPAGGSDAVTKFNPSVFSMSRLVCNSCRHEVDGIAFRTSCGHFYCPKCAQQTFQSSSQCSICGAHLTEKSVKEVTVGIPVFEDTFSSCLFQNVLQNPSWENMKVNIQAAQAQYQELLHFTTTQLILSSTQAKVQQYELEDVCRRQALQQVRLKAYTYVMHH